MDGGFPGEQGNGYPAAGRRTGGFRGTAENSKTRLCNRWLAGECRFGDRCNFAHGEHELRALPERPGGPGFSPAGGGRGAPRGPPGGPGGYPPNNSFGGRGSQQPGGRGMGGYGGAAGRGYGGYGAQPAGFGGGGGYNASVGVATGGGYGSGQPAGVPEDVWAAQGYPVAGPNGWTMYRTKDTGEPYYHNSRTSETVWDRPQDWPQSGP